MLNGLIAIVAFLHAIFYAGGLDGIDIYEWRVSTEVSFYHAAVYVDPIFVVWCQRDLPVDHAMGLSFGNTILMRGDLEGTTEGDYVLHHEVNHVRQLQALGWPYFFAKGTPWLEPPGRGYHDVNWEHPEENDERMWLPPDWWPDQWHFFRIEAKFG